MFTSPEAVFLFKQEKQFLSAFTDKTQPPEWAVLANTGKEQRPRQRPALPPPSNKAASAPRKGLRTQLAKT